MSEANPGVEAEAPSVGPSAPSATERIKLAGLRAADFSPAGLVKYDNATRNYVVALQQTSRGIARLKNSDLISAYHVQLAVDLLSSGKKTWVSRISDVGTLLIGAGLGYFGGMVFDSSYTFKNLLISFVPLLLGCVAYAYAWGRRSG
jgi:hypothetical protein